VVRLCVCVCVCVCVCPPCLPFPGRSEFKSEDGEMWPDLVHSFWTRWSAVDTVARQVADDVSMASKSKTDDASPSTPLISLPRKLMGDGKDPDEINRRKGELGEYLKSLRDWGASLPPDTTLWDMVRLVGPVKEFWSTRDVSGKDCIKPGEEPSLSEMFAPGGESPARSSSSSTVSGIWSAVSSAASSAAASASSAAASLTSSSPKPSEASSPAVTPPTSSAADVGAAPVKLWGYVGFSLGGDGGGGPQREIPGQCEI
jgi:hypothetical protein